MGETTEPDDWAAELSKDYPAWHPWEGVGETGFYARRPKSSPPKVLRADTVEALRGELEEYTAQQNRWEQRHN